MKQGLWIIKHGLWVMKQGLINFMVIDEWIISGLLRIVGDVTDCEVIHLCVSHHDIRLMVACQRIVIWNIGMRSLNVTRFLPFVTKNFKQP